MVRTISTPPKLNYEDPLQKEYLLRVYMVRGSCGRCKMAGVGSRVLTSVRGQFDANFMLNHLVLMLTFLQFLLSYFFIYLLGLLTFLYLPTYFLISCCFLSDAQQVFPPGDIELRRAHNWQIHPFPKLSKRWWSVQNSTNRHKHTTKCSWFGCLFLHMFVMLVGIPMTGTSARPSLCPDSWNKNGSVV